MGIYGWTLSMNNLDKYRNISFISSIYETFLNNEAAIKRYLSRFFCRHEDVDDMAQETFLKAYKYTQNRHIEFPKAYLYKVARSVALRELSKKSRQLTDYIEEAAVPELGEQYSLEDEVMAEQALGHFCESIAELPPQCRRVFLMRKYQAMSHREIAKTLNISVSAVEQHITLALKRCRLSAIRRETSVQRISESLCFHVGEI